jgi:hypothetical protein
MRLTPCLGIRSPTLPALPALPARPARLSPFRIPSAGNVSISVGVRLPGLLPVAVASCGLLPIVVVVAYAVACAVDRDK